MIRELWTGLFALLFTLPLAIAPAMAAAAAEANAIQGQILYNSMCASCHGMTGKGDGPTAEVLAENDKPANFKKSTRTKKELEAIITNGSPKSAMMAAYGDSLSKEQISALADYILALKKQK